MSTAKAAGALAAAYGHSVAGKSGSVVFDGTDKTANLPGGYLYVLSSTADCFIAVGAGANVAANQVYLPAFASLAITPDGPGGVLHVTQVTGAGTLYYSAWTPAG